MNDPSPPMNTIIAPSELADLREKGNVCIVDCRFSLADTGAGRRLYSEGHIPGAMYAHLDEVLSNPAATDRGRHPLPPAAILAERFSAMGIGPDTYVVAYEAAGAMIAPRLWWLLTYMGHKRAAVLDGGLQAWVDAGYAVESTIPALPEPSHFIANPTPSMFIVADELPGMELVVDSRSPERYTGETEPIDKKAGHIPGAVNSPYAATMNTDGTFLPPDVLNDRFQSMLNGVSPENTAFYCGSGVTACVNLLAMAIAGLRPARLYAGSWSDWSSDPSRPIETGNPR